MVVKDSTKLLQAQRACYPAIVRSRSLPSCHLPRSPLLAHDALLRRAAGKPRSQCHHSVVILLTVDIPVVSSIDNIPASIVWSPHHPLCRPIKDGKRKNTRLLVTMQYPRPRSFQSDAMRSTGAGCRWEVRCRTGGARASLRFRVAPPPSP